MAQKAEFSGTCQGCGHHQKLPKGKLSLHGYTVEWGFFSGTCDGARELPYEQSCEYCKTCVVRATKHREDVLKAAANYRRPITEPVVDSMEFQVGRDAKHRPVVRTFHNVRIERGTNKYGREVFTATVEVDGESKTFDLSNGSLGYQHEIKTTLQAAQYFQERLAKGCDQRANQIQSYINWQQKRIDDWKLQPLKPVTDEPVAKSMDIYTLKDVDTGQTEWKRRLGYRAKNLYWSRLERLIATGLLTKVSGGSDDRSEWMTVEITDAGREMLRLRK